MKRVSPLINRLRNQVHDLEAHFEHAAIAHGRWTAAAKIAETIAKLCHGKARASLPPAGTVRKEGP